MESIPASVFAERYSAEALLVRDVRKSSEYEAEHVENAENTPLAYLCEHMAEFSKDQTNYVHCAGGYRSMIAVSILKARGYHNVVDVAGGFAAISQTDVRRTNFVCQSKQKTS